MVTCSTIKIGEPVKLEDVAACVSMIPIQKRTPVLNEIAFFCKEHGVDPDKIKEMTFHERQECVYTGGVDENNFFGNPTENLSSIKSATEYNLGDLSIQLLGLGGKYRTSAYYEGSTLIPSKITELPYMKKTLAIVTDEKFTEMRNLVDRLRKEEWDEEVMTKGLVQDKYTEWKQRRAWDLTAQEMKKEKHPFKDFNVKE